MWDIALGLPNVYDTTDILFAQPVFRSVFHEAEFCIDHKNTFAVGGFGFFDKDNAGRYSGPEEKVGGQADNAFDISLFGYEIFTDLRFGIASE